MYRFTDDCRIGIATIDDEHERLFALINEAVALLAEGRGQEIVAKSLIYELKKYAEIHFEHEEAYMESINDPELDRQRRDHKGFADKVSGFALQLETAEDPAVILDSIIKYIAGWLHRHILGSDIMIGHFKAEADVDAGSDDIFAFTSQYETGIAIVDEEHKELFSIIRTARNLVNEQLLHDKYDAIMKIIGELRAYTVKHFHDEEEYMESIGYDGLEAQKYAHQMFIDRLAEIDIFELDDNQQEYLLNLVDYLANWLVNHILMMDKLIPVR